MPADPPLLRVHRPLRGRRSTHLAWLRPTWWVLALVLGWIWAQPAQAAPPDRTTTEAAPPSPPEEVGANDDANAAVGGDFEDDEQPPPGGDDDEAPLAEGAPGDTTPVELEPPMGGPTEPAAGAVAVEEGSCEIEDPSAPLYPVTQALVAMRPGGVRIDQCRIESRALLGRQVQAELIGSDQDLVLYLLQSLATDGYWIELTAVDVNTLRLRARASRSGERGVFFVGVERIDLDGKWLAGDDATRLREITGLDQPVSSFSPDDLQGRLAALGYASVFRPFGPGGVRIELAPGRRIRRVRVRGATPVPVREVQRQLTLRSRPGAIARGRCAKPEELRKKARRPPICAPQDLACRKWEASEVARLEQYLFDQGYLRGSVTLGLACGRADDEADLQVYVDKGPAHRIDRRGITVQGAPQTQDARWLRRQFMPRVLLVFRKRVTREFMEETKEAVERTYAEPSLYSPFLSATSTTRPHPQVRVSTSYDDYDVKHRDNIPRTKNLPLDVQVELGRSVEADFTPPPGGERLSFGPRELQRQLQIFTRREPPSQAVATREAANLRAFYQSRGYVLAEVEGFYEDFGSVQKLRFVIDEGPRARIGSLELEKPQGVPPAVATGVELELRRSGRLRRRGRFGETDALADLGTVLEAYASSGYLCSGAIVRVAFWEGALAEAAAADEAAARGEPVPPSGERTWADITPQDLLASGKYAAWLDQLDPDGVDGIRDSDRIEVHVRIIVRPGPRVLTAKSEQVRYLEEPIGPSRRVIDAPANEAGDWGARRILRSSPLRLPGSDAAGNVPVTLDTQRETTRSVRTNYRSSGYPLGDAELNFRYEDPATGETFEIVDLRELDSPRIAMCEDRGRDAVVQLEPVISVYEGKRGKFGQTLIRGNFKTRSWVLERELQYETGDMYSRASVDRTIRSMEQTGTAAGIQVTSYPVNCEGQAEGDCVVHHVYSIEEAKDVSAEVEYGVGAATLNPLYVFARPSFPNLFGTGVDLELQALWGFDVGSELGELCAGQACYERTVGAALVRPHVFGTRADAGLNGQFQRRATPARGRIDSALLDARLSWRVGEHWNVFSGYLFQLANISKDVVKPLGGSGGATPWIDRSEAIVSDLSGMLQVGAAWDRADNAFNPNRGFLASMDARLASPFLGGNDWWAMVNGSWQHFIPIPTTGDRLQVRYSLSYGHAVPFKGPLAPTTSIPEVWRYYGGGTAALGLRGILPETMLLDIEEIPLPYGGVVYRPRAQGGHIRAIGTLALQVVSVKSLLGGRLAHSIFYDAGIITQRWRQVQLVRDYRHSVGLNFVKFDVNVVTLALGYAVLVPTKNNVRPTDDRNGRFVFDVGVTF